MPVLSLFICLYFELKFEFPLCKQIFFKPTIKKTAEITDNC
jgi:hypothetical protein